MLKRNKKKPPFLAEFDLYAPPIRFNYNGLTAHKTQCGGGLSIAIVFVLVVYFY